MKKAPAIVVQLIHIQGPLKGEIQEFSQPVISIGRLPACHLCFPADLTSVSRTHAEIVREGNQFKLIDQSTNGTFINGKRVKEAYLKNGDVLAFSEAGPKVSFLTQMREGLPTTDSLPPPISKRKPYPPLDREPPGLHQEVKRPEWNPPELVQQKFEKREGVSLQSVKPSLTIQYGPTIRSFKELPITIGKSSKSGFMLDHPALFDQHAQISFSQNQYWIKDLTGQRLVLINHHSVGFEAPLKPNDEVAFSPQGPVFRFLGEGRLAEVTESSAGESMFPYEKGKPRREVPKEKASKGLKSVFKKLVDR